MRLAVCAHAWILPLEGAKVGTLGFAPVSKLLIAPIFCHSHPEVGVV
jgi:hypothetical protein